MLPSPTDALIAAIMNDQRVDQVKRLLACLFKFIIRALNHYRLRANSSIILLHDTIILQFRDSLLVSMAKSKKSANTNTIANNKKAFHDYFIEDEFEAGLSLQGWEVKSMRAGRVQLKESYVTIDKGELYLQGAHISPLNSASTHVVANPLRNRKLLLKRYEISRLIGQVDRAGYTLAPIALYWSKGRAKLKIGLAKGKKQHDKRATIKEREWQREQQRLLKRG